MSVLKHSAVKSVLLLLDTTAASQAAKRVAFTLARRHGAFVTGMAVIDPDIVAGPEATPLGGDSYKQHKDKVVLDRARVEAVELARRFCHEAGDAHVNCDGKVESQGALKALVEACAVNDIIVTGFDTSFGAVSEGTVSPVIEHLLRDNPRPLVVVPNEPLECSNTVAAYDGSVAAMRALQLFCFSQIGHKSDMTVVCVQEQGADALCQQACEYLRDHGYKAIPKPVQSTGDRAKEIVAAARAADAGLIVAGAYGHNGWREWLLGTTTKALLATSPTPLFLHH